MKTCLTVTGLPRIILTIGCLAASPGCSDPEADYRARICKEEGVPEVSIQACKLSRDEFSRIMEPIRVRQEQEFTALFNTAVSLLQTRKIPKDQYVDVSFMQLSSDVDQLHQLEESKWLQHPLFGKHIRIKAWIKFSPIDLEESRLFESTRLWIEDSAPVDADIESLSREERAFIKNQCLYLLET